MTDSDDRAMDFLYGYLEDTLWGEKYSSVDVFLDELDPNRLSAVLVVAVLIGTLGAAPKLLRRNAFVRRSVPVLESEPEGLRAVLDGLVEDLDGVLEGRVA